ncbi:MAG: addiction module protein [Alphaproteobacteria bacterium]|nr:MAG: addiction module protein [Alphaproteobacteria bacterium]
MSEAHCAARLRLWRNALRSASLIAPYGADEQKAELDRRIAEHERDPGSAIPWEVVRERLRANYG